MARVVLGMPLLGLPAAACIACSCTGNACSCLRGSCLRGEGREAPPTSSCGPHDDAWRDGCCDAALRSRATSHSHALSPFVSRRCVTAAGLEKDVPTPVSLFFTFLLGPLGLTFHLITRFSPRPVPRPRPCLNPEASTLPVSVSLCLSSVSVYCVCHECRPRAVLARVGP